MKKGQLTVYTPYYGYTELSASYLYEGDEGEVRLKREDSQILILISQVFSPDAHTYNMRVNTPYREYETMTLSINRPVGHNRINAEYQRGRHSAISATAKYELSAPIAWVSVEAESSLEGFSTSALHLSYNMFEQKAKLMFSKEAKR